MNTFASLNFLWNFRRTKVFFLRGKVRRGDLKILNLESCKLYVYSRDRQRSYLNRGKEARRLLIAFGSRPSPLEYEIAIEIAGSRVD